MKRIVLLAFVTVCLSACDGGTPQAVEHAASNPTYELTLLFIHDGVKVYRFYDQNHYHYLAIPNSGAAAEVQTTQGCGKNCTYDDTIRTVASIGVGSNK